MLVLLFSRNSIILRICIKYAFESDVIFRACQTDSAGVSCSRGATLHPVWCVPLYGGDVEAVPCVIDAESRDVLDNDGMRARADMSLHTCTQTGPGPWSCVTVCPLGAKLYIGRDGRREGRQRCPLGTARRTSACGRQLTELPRHCHTPLADL